MDILPYKNTTMKRIDISVPWHKTITGGELYRRKNIALEGYYISSFTDDLGILVFWCAGKELYGREMRRFVMASDRVIRYLLVTNKI